MSHGDCSEQESLSGRDRRLPVQCQPGSRTSLNRSMRGPSPARHADSAASMVSQSRPVLSEERCEEFKFACMGILFILRRF